MAAGRNGSSALVGDIASLVFSGEGDPVPTQNQPVVVQTAMEEA